MRFSRLALHARGGLGAVYLAKDEELGRTVALKEIQEQHADHTGSRSRFTFEAEITGQLEHPGIVPVYGLGSYGDGRPYYAMRFIRGEPMDEAIKRFHNADAPGRDPAERALALRGLLGRFVDVCNAIGFAHARGVIHRDIKPANVMLGEYGETLVVDWGLAKYVGRADEPGEGAAASGAFASGSPTGTVEGSAVGTPAFMPPEQALGEQDKVGPCSDVYALGATLYHLLTGKVPVEAESAFATLEKVARGERTPARQANPTVPKALEAVCDRAMAREPGGRYESAKELAAEVERWLADEPVKAYAEPLSQRLRRWAKRNRTLVAAAAALLLAGVVGLSAGLWAVNSERAQTARQRDEANENLERALKAEEEANDNLKTARANQDRAEKAERQAKANLERAEANLKLARKAIDDTFGLAKEHPLLLEERHAPVTKLLLEKVLPYFQRFRDQKPDDRALAAEQAECLAGVGYITNEIGNKAEALENYGRAREILEKLAKDHPEDAGYRDNLALVLNSIGHLQSEAGKQREALESIERALEIEDKLVKDYPKTDKHSSHLADTLINLGNRQSEAGEPQEALKSFERAREILDELARDQPKITSHRADLANALGSLGVLQSKTGKPKEALKSLERAREIQDKLAGDQPEVTSHRANLANTLSNMSELQSQAGKRQEALKSFERAREILDELARDYPAVTKYRAALAATINGLGNLQSQAGKPQEALKSYERAREIFDKLARDQPLVASHRSELAATLINLGHLQSEAGKLQEARKHLSQAIDLLTALRKIDPNSMPYRTDLLASRLFRAHTHEKLGRYLDAASDLDVVIDLEPVHARLIGWQMRRVYCFAHGGDHRSAVAAIGQLASEKKLTTTHLVYHGACIFSLSAAACSRDSSRPLPEREKNPEVWARTALRLLGACASDGHFKTAKNFDLLRTDPSLAFLRSRDDFKRWLADVEARQNKKQ